MTSITTPQMLGSYTPPMSPNHPPNSLVTNDVATNPSAQLADALANLTAAVQQLEAVIQALAGAGNVSGDGVSGGGQPADSLQGAALCNCPCHGVSQIPPGKGADVSSEQYGPVLQGPANVEPPPAPIGGDVRQRIVQIAQQELAKNVREDAGSNKDSKGEIIKYRKAVFGPGEDPYAAEAWCADFASWVSREAGVPIGKNGQGEDYTVALVDWAKSVGRWQPRASADPKPGDLIMLDWDKNGKPNHVAIVERVEGDKIITIGGNEQGPGGQGVHRSTHTRTSGTILGYIPPGQP